MYQVEKNIPLPASKHSPNNGGRECPVRKALLACKVGESFVMDGKYQGRPALYKIRYGIDSAIRREGKDKWRVWRLS